MKKINNSPDSADIIVRINLEELFLVGISGFSNTVNSTGSTAVGSKVDISSTSKEQVNQAGQQEQQFNDKKLIDGNKSELTKEEAEHIVKGMNEFLQPQYRSVSFKLHEELDRYYVEVIDNKTKDVIREIPDKKILDMYAKMKEYLGLFIDEKL